MAISGDRIAIAHVGAALVRVGWVPPDLSVRIPSLEDALVELLERAGPSSARRHSLQPRLIGAVSMNTAARPPRADRAQVDDPRAPDVDLRLRLPGGDDAHHRRLVRHEADVAFDWVNPSQWYVASYLTVVIAATGLIMVPVHLASYRERGVLRRFAAAGFPDGRSRWPS